MYNKQALSQVQNRDKYQLKQPVSQYQSQVPQSKSEKNESMPKTEKKSMQRKKKKVKEESKRKREINDDDDEIKDNNDYQIKREEERELSIEEESGTFTESIPQSQGDVIVEDGIEYDKHGNLLSEEFDLGKDGSFNDFSVLIGMFYPSSDCAEKALRKKGFQVTVVSTELEFLRLLRENGGQYDVVWVISSNSKLSNFSEDEFKELLINHHKSGKGLMIFGDNDPFYLHANILLPSLVGTTLVGNNMGTKTLAYGDSKVNGQFDKEHILFAGINNLYEGITICYPGTDSKLNVLATGSDGKPCILNCETGKSYYEGGGRIVIDTGFTKLFREYWATAGQARYVVNATVWLVDLEGKHGIDLNDFK